MTDRERLDKLTRCFSEYLGQEGCMPIKGWRNQFYDGVLWAFARLGEIYPSDDEVERHETDN